MCYRSTSMYVTNSSVKMPIVDGFTATKMIRSYEKTHSANALSRRAALNGRIPIFAVSASLVEKEQQRYKDVGFDGWVLKPIDFSRVNELLKGLVDDSARKSCLYMAGHWEQGGWFFGRQVSDRFSSDTVPSEKPPTTVPAVESMPPQRSKAS